MAQKSKQSSASKRNSADTQIPDTELNEVSGGLSLSGLSTSPLIKPSLKPQLGGITKPTLPGGTFASSTSP